MGSDKHFPSYKAQRILNYCKALSERALELEEDENWTEEEEEEEEEVSLRRQLRTTADHEMTTEPHNSGGDSNVATKNNDNSSRDPKPVSDPPNPIDASGPSGDKGKRKRDTDSRAKSQVWDHFTKLEGDPKLPRASCNYCGKTYACDAKKDGTSTMWTHVKNKCKKYRVEDKI